MADDGTFIAPPSPSSPSAAAVVTYLGPEASYTHQAALARFPTSAKDIGLPPYKLTPAGTIDDVFIAVQSGQAAAGVVPFENSSNGAVIFTLDLFADCASRFPDLVVVGEVFVPVRHCVLGVLPSGTAADPNSPGSTANITKLYSHPQAWGQCKRFLGENGPLHHAKRQDVLSTSKAAELVASEAAAAAEKGEICTSAAIASKMAAELHGLSVLAENIEDESRNATRFLVLRRKHQRLSTLQNEQVPLRTESVAVATEAKSLVTFTVHQHGSPGALADCLAVFKRHSLSLTSINTRPSGDAPWHYRFFVEFLGQASGTDQTSDHADSVRLTGNDSGTNEKPLDENIKRGFDSNRYRPAGAVAAALADLDTVAKEWRWLGTWENGLPEERRNVGLQQTA